MKRPRYSTLQLWAFRDVQRRPIESLVLAAAIALTIVISGTLLLFPRAIYDTLANLMPATPSIVVRRVNAVGWQPLPAQKAVHAATSVIGVVSAKPRIWGVVSGPDGPLTVIGTAKDSIPDAYPLHLMRLPNIGEAVVGPAIGAGAASGLLDLQGSFRKSYRIIGNFPDKTGMFTHDLVLLNVVDARKLIGLPDGYASDLAVDVFHENEQDAILADLTDAFPWPVRCTTRRQSAGIYAGRFSRDSALNAITVTPAVLAICLLVAVNIRRSIGRQTDIGIMKAMGWTTGDIVRLQLYRALAVGLPSAVIGICLAFFLVYGPGSGRLAELFLNWETLPPNLHLEPRGAVTVLLQVAGCVLAPVVVSALTPAVRAATTDAHELIEGTGP